jgi:uncharacterized membrane protein YgcG
MEQTNPETPRTWYGRRRAGVVVLAAAVSLVAALLGVHTASATSVPPDGPPGEPQPSPSPTGLPPLNYTSLDQLVQGVGVNRQCPGSGPAGPALGTGGVTPKPGQRVVHLVVTGDSYMSGEGTGDYYNKDGRLVPPLSYNAEGQPVYPAGYTQVDYLPDWRHRSPNAPAMLAIDQLRRLNPNVVFDVKFNASSGATTQSYFTAQSDNGRSNPPQGQGIDAGTDLTVVGFGGNDIGFGPLLQKAMTTSDALTFANYATPYLSLVNETLTDDQEWAEALKPGTPSTLVARYIQMIRTMHASGQKTRVMMVTYPQGLSVHIGDTEWTLNRLIQPGERTILRSLAPKLAAAMRKAQSILVTHKIQVDLLDLQSVFQGHEIGMEDPYVNDVTVAPPAPTGSAFNLVQETAHPNRKGAELLATYYAQMFATELGVVAPVRGNLPPGSASHPCLEKLNPPPPSNSGSTSGTTTGTTTGSGGGGGSGGGSSTPAPGPGSVSGSTGDSGGDSGSDSPTGAPDDSPPPGGFGDIDPVTPVQPTDPSIPDGLQGDAPQMPVYPPAPYPPGGEAPMDLPASSVIININ